MCWRRRIAKTLTTTFSVLAAMGGLLVITFCFKLILDADDLIGDSDITVADKDSQEAESQRTTDLTPVGVSPDAESRRQGAGIDEISKRIAAISFTVGVSAVVFGLAGICAAKIQRCPCTCTIGFIAMLITAAYGLASAVLLAMYYVTE